MTIALVFLLGVAGFLLNPAVYNRVYTVAADAPTLAGVTNVSLCVSRVVFLRNTQTNQVVRQQIMRMIVRVSDYATITLFPHRDQCDID